MSKIARWLYFTIMLLLIAAASVVTFVYPNTVVRPVFIMAFLFICPGMAVVRFFRLNSMLVELSLILAFSIAIDATVAGIVLYTGLWSPIRIFIILILFSLLGALLQIMAPYLLLLQRKMHDIFDLNAAYREKT